MDDALGTSSILWHVHGIIIYQYYQALFCESSIMARLVGVSQSQWCPHALVGWSFKSRCWDPLNFCEGPPSFVNTCLVDQGLLPIN